MTNQNNKVSNEKNSDLKIPQEFLDENKKDNKIFFENKKGGPYSKVEKFVRRQEVFRLHFEQGLPAFKIAQMLDVNRHTVENDIRFWFAKLVKEWKYSRIEAWFMRQMYRFEAQRTRLIQTLEKQTNFKEKMVIERLIFDIDAREAQLFLNLQKNEESLFDNASHLINDFAEKQNLKFRVFSSNTFIPFSEKGFEKVKKIRNEEKWNFHKVVIR